MLYRETTEGVFTPWNPGTQPVGGILYAPDLETNPNWSDAELAAACQAYRPAAAEAIPDGKRQVSTSVQRVNGVVRYVHELEDIPAPTPEETPISMRQLRLGLLASGFAPTFIMDVIAAIPDVPERAVATIWYEETSTVEWGHPMTQSLMAAAGISEAAAKAMWLAASQIPA